MRYKPVVLYGPPAVGKSTLIKHFRLSTDSRLQKACIVDLEDYEQHQRHNKLQELVKSHGASPLIVGAADLWPPNDYAWEDCNVVALIPEDIRQYQMRLYARNSITAEKANQDNLGARKSILNHCFANQTKVACWLDPLDFDDKIDEFIAEIIDHTLGAIGRKASPKLHFVAGIPRSGSTWLYNAIRLTLKRFEPTTYGAWIREYCPSRTKSPHVVKIHEPNTAAGIHTHNLVFTSRRQLHAVAKSLKRINASKPAGKKWYKDIAGFRAILENSLVQHSNWAKHSTYDMVYERMMSNQENEVQMIALALGYQLTFEEARDIAVRVDELKAPDQSEVTSEGHDPFNLLHPKHRSMSEEQIQPLDQQELYVLSEIEPRWPTS